jgi:hypothetical protein
MEAIVKPQQGMRRFEMSETTRFPIESTTLLNNNNMKKHSQKFEEN